VNPTKGHSPVGIASESNNLLSHTSSLFSWVPPIEHLPHCIAGSGFGCDPVVLDFIREQSGTASDAACMCRTSYSLECHHLLQTVVSLVERKVLNSSLMGTGEGRRSACPPGDSKKRRRSLGEGQGRPADIVTIINSGSFGLTTPGAPRWTASDYHPMPPTITSH
jgi:hypothetical protein